MTSWWKPIETGGLYSCKDCPQSIHNHPMVAELQEQVRGLKDTIAWLNDQVVSEMSDKIDKWRTIADNLAENGYFHSTAGAESKDAYLWAVEDETK